MPRVASSGRVLSNRGVVPTDLATNNLWLRSDLLSLNGSFVSGWTDKSPSGFTVSQATPSLQAAYNATDATFNGYPSVQYDGVDDFHSRAGVNLLSGGAGYTFICVWAFIAPIPAAYTFAMSNFDSTSGNGPELGNTNAQTRGVNHSGIATGYDGNTTTSAEIVVSRWTPGLPVAMRVNGIAQVLSTPPNTVGTTTNAAIGIGGRPNGLQNMLGKLAEVVAFGRPLLDGELIRIERYLGYRYQIATF